MRVFYDIKNLKEMIKNGSVQFLAALYNSIDYSRKFSPTSLTSDYEDDD
jgi:hypothetical protein